MVLTFGFSPGLLEAGEIFNHDKRKGRWGVGPSACQNELDGLVNEAVQLALKRPLMARGGMDRGSKHGCSGHKVVSANWSAMSCKVPVLRLRRLAIVTSCSAPSACCKRFSVIWLWSEWLTIQQRMWLRPFSTV